MEFNNLYNFQDQANNSSSRLSNGDDFIPNFFEFENENEASNELNLYLSNAISHEYIINVIKALGIKIEQPSKSRHIPRPMNKFMIFRQRVSFLLKCLNLPLNNRQVSEVIGYIWKYKPSNVDQLCKTLSNATLRRHQEEHPGYKYKPKKGDQRKSATNTLRSNVHEQTNEINNTFVGSFISDTTFTQYIPSYMGHSSPPYSLNYSQEKDLVYQANAQYIMNPMDYYPFH